MRRNRGWCAVAVMSCLSALLGGCAAGGGGGDQTGARTTTDEPTDVARAESQSSESNRTPLLINGQPVPWSVLRPRLAEAGGGVVVDELVLEYALEHELRARGRAISDDDVQAERERWTGLVGAEALAAQSEATIRARRGLGPIRFDRLLWRNAALRALLDRAETEVTDDELRLAREIRTGRRYAVTGVVAPDSRTALRIAQAASGDNQSAIAGLWTASTAENLRPWHGIVSPADPAYPLALRRVLPGTPPGTASGVVALDDGFGLVVVHTEIPPGSMQMTDNELRDELTIRKSRLAMERLADRLIARTSVHVMDRNLSVSP